MFTTYKNDNNDRNAVFFEHIYPCKDKDKTDAGDAVPCSILVGEEPKARECKGGISSMILSFLFCIFSFQLIILVKPIALRMCKSVVYFYTRVLNGYMLAGVALYLFAPNGSEP